MKDINLVLIGFLIPVLIVVFAIVYSHKVRNVVIPTEYNFVYSSCDTLDGDCYGERLGKTKETHTVNEGRGFEFYLYDVGTKGSNPLTTEQVNGLDVVGNSRTSPDGVLFYRGDYTGPEGILFFANHVDKYYLKKGDDRVYVNIESEGRHRNFEFVGWVKAQ